MVRKNSGRQVCKKFWEKLQLPCWRFDKNFCASFLRRTIIVTVLSSVHDFSILAYGSCRRSTFVSCLLTIMSPWLNAYSFSCLKFEMFIKVRSFHREAFWNVYEPYCALWVVEWWPYYSSQHNPTQNLSSKKCLLTPALIGKLVPGGHISRLFFNLLTYLNY